MARAVYIFSKYIVLPGVFAYALMQIAKPDEAELKKVQRIMDQYVLIVN